MTDEELAEIVDNLRVLGSDVSDVEAKRAEGGLPKSVRETLSSFSNSQSGVIILGLDEASGFQATGVADPSKMAADLASLCANDMEPKLRPLIQAHIFEGVSLVVAEIPEIDPSLKPCYYKGAGITKGSYVRVHDGDHRLSSFEVQMMLSGRGQPREDEEAVEGSSVAELDDELVQGFVARLRTNRPYAFRDLGDKDVLRRSRILVEGKAGECLSVAGLLALGSFPQERFPQLMLTFIHYPTESGAETVTGARFLDNVALEGPIPVIVRDALAVLRRNMARRSVVSGPGRSDVWEYPETALREAVVNALVHRDLSPASRGAQVQAEMYPDRLLVRNPGGLFGPVSVDTLGQEGVSSSRNAVLMRILEDVPIPGESRTVCENRGSGIRSMISALRAAGMSPPRFEDRISSFSVTFPNHALLSDAVVEWIRSLGESHLTDSQCMALAMLHEGAILDNPTYRNATGIDSRIATSELQDLVARELVVQDGSRRWARYSLSNRVAEGHAQPSVRRRAPADRRTEILQALGDETCSRAELAERTSLTDQVVLRWLRILRKEGAVEITDADRPQSKNTRYQRAPAHHGQGQTVLEFE